MIKYWEKHPPVHFLVAGLAGYKPPEEIEELKKNDLNSLIEFLQGNVQGVIRSA